MNIRDLEQAFRGNDWDVSITSSEHPYERKHRVLQQSIICYVLIITCFLMAVVLLYVTYHPPVIDGTSSKNIQEDAFHAFVLFFTSCASLLIGRQIK